MTTGLVIKTIYSYYCFPTILFYTATKYGCPLASSFRESLQMDSIDFVFGGRLGLGLWTYQFGELG